MLGIILDRGLDRSLSSQLCDALRSRMLSGELKEGDRLPSTRELSRELSLSRTLVLEAFEQLEAEGYIEGRRGSGSYVLSAGLIRGTRISQNTVIETELRYSSAEKKLRDTTIDFKTGAPALDFFPRELWARALADAARSLPQNALGYGAGAGLPILREETAAFLFRSRGLRTSAEDIYVTSGISQALGLVSRVLLRPGSRAILENPCQPALSGLLRREGVELVACPVDAEGLDTSRLPRDKSALAFVTPSHQFPLGPVLSARRRAALIEWARATDSMILEDDFDGDFRYGGAPLSPLRELDPERVVYAGSFSKAFSPALRLGYAVVPRRISEGWRACRELMDIHSCSYTQYAMAGLIASGAFERHVRRMKKVYAARRSALLAALGDAFGPLGGVLGSLGAGPVVMGEAAGLHVALRFDGPRFTGLRFDAETVSRIASEGATVYPAERFAFEALPGIERTLLLGYGCLSEEEIARGVAALARALLGNGVEGLA